MAGRTSGTRAGKGMGWGGPAKGKSVATAAPSFTGDAPGPGRGNFSIAGEDRAAREERHAEEMRQIYYDFATDDVREDNIRLSAATHLLDRIEGKPAQKVAHSGRIDSDTITEIRRTIVRPPDRDAS